MLDERTRRAGEAAAAARRRAFDATAGAPTAARPLGVVPIVGLCLLGAAMDGYAAVAFAFGPGFDAASAAIAAFALVAATALATDQPWAWTITWTYLAVHVFFDLVTAAVLGPIGLVVATVYALALTYATARRAVEMTE